MRVLSNEENVPRILVQCLHKECFQRTKKAIRCVNKVKVCINRLTDKLTDLVETIVFFLGYIKSSLRGNEKMITEKQKTRNAKAKLITFIQN